MPTPMRPEGGTVITLEGALSLYEVDAARRRLLQGFEAGTDIVVDLGQVTDCDAAGVQLLISARQTAARRGLSFRIREASPVVTEACLRLGLNPAEALNLEMES
jgi:anti-sigma B factor antagonist